MPTICRSKDYCFNKLKRQEKTITAKFTTDVDVTTEVEVEISLDEYLNELNHDDKIKLLGMLCEDLGQRAEEPKDEKYVTEYLSNCAPFEIKRILVNVLGVHGYYADEALRNALEPVITAR